MILEILAIAILAALIVLSIFWVFLMWGGPQQ
jgi:hypothetical protein